MPHLDSVLAFSHTYCVAICSVLVPFNLITTLITLVRVGFDRPTVSVQRSSGLAIAGSLLMVLHVLTWLVVGVVRVQTFVLFSLGLCCLLMSGWALCQPQTLRQVLRFLARWGQQTFRFMGQRVEIP